MKETALVIANGHLKSVYGKTTHGLVRKCERYDIVGVIDPDSAGERLHEILPGAKPLPIFASVTQAIETLPEKPRYCITGIATHGGKIPAEIKKVFVEALRNGVSLINSLHEFLSDQSDLVALAEKQDLRLLDIRKPRATRNLRFWSGEILSVKTPILAVMGTDCALGKRTTTQLLVDACRKQGLNAHMIYTGQTGWLQGGKYGFIFDVTPNDFVSGELEGAILDCDRNEKPDLMIIEGQSSLRNPSGPCGAEFLLSGRAKGVILQHAPRRMFYDGFEEHGLKIPPVEDEIRLIESYGAKVLALTVNTEKIPGAELAAEKASLEKRSGRLAVAPLEDGVEVLVPVLKKFISAHRK